MERKLWLVRDRLGIKPLYYAEKDGAIFFSSEIRSILASGSIDRKLNKNALVEYLQYQCVHAPNTMIEGVQMLNAGSYMEISDESISTHLFWKPWQEKHIDKDPIDIQQNIRDLLTSSVERRLVADVPFGAFLSGGIDSSLIVGIMSERLGNQVDTFNVSFDESEFSEAKYAQIISKKFKTDHNEIKLKPTDFLSIIPNAMDDMDHPSGDGFNTWLVSKVTRESGITMALSGLGGDELFGGYPIFKRYVQLMDQKWILSFPIGLRRMVASILKKVRPGMSSEKIARILNQELFDLENIYQFDRQVLLDDQVEGLLNKTSLPSKSVFDIVHRNVGYDSEGYVLSPLSRVSWAEMNTYMQNVLLRDADQMSMAHSLEVRVPFLDHKLIEFVMGVRDEIKYPATPKQLLVDSFSDLLPNEIVNRKKMGFVFPWEQWLKNELNDFVVVGLNKLKNRAEFNPEAIDRIWQQFLNNDPRVSWSRIWPMVVLGNWLEKNGIE